MDRQLPALLCAATLVWCLPAAASAQQFVAPSPQTLPYGGAPVLQVGPDGIVHLDDAQGTTSAAPVVGQPVVGQPVLGQPVLGQPGPVQQGVVLGQPQPGRKHPFLGRFVDWLHNDPLPWQYDHRTGFFGEFLFLRARNAEVDYALPIDGVVALGDEVPVGPVAVVDQDYEPGFRVGGVLRMTEAASVRGQYTYFRSGASSAATIDPGDVLRSLVTHPNAANAATDTLAASARHDIDFDLVDVDFRSLLCGCENCEDRRCATVVNGLIGGRYVNLDQQFNASFDVLGTRTVASSVDFEGGGIRLGIEAEHHSTQTGFFAYGSGVGNLMVGEFRGAYRQQSGANGQEAFASWAAGRVVPALDLELGVGWVGPRRRLKFSGGYLVSTWLNVVTIDDLIDAAQRNAFDDLDGILTFDGLVARATWEF